MASDDDRAEQRSGIIAFRAPWDLMDGIDAIAAAEGISRSDVARRAAMRDLSNRKQEPATPDEVRPWR